MHTTFRLVPVMNQPGLYNVIHRRTNEQCCLYDVTDKAFSTWHITYITTDEMKELLELVNDLK